MTDAQTAQQSESPLPARARETTHRIRSVDGGPLGEHDTSQPLRLPERSHTFLDEVVNEDRARIGVTYDREGRARLETGSHVGIVALPDDIVVQIDPKAAGDNLLPLLMYAFGVESEIVRSEVEIEAGRTFLDAIGLLYLHHVDTLLTRGLNREYVRTKESEEHLRGRWDIQRQIQEEPLASTRFACEYERLTADTLLNRSITFATDVLAGLVETRGVASRLERRREQLRREVTLTPVRALDLRDITLTRLDQHYGEILDLTRLVLSGIHVEDLRTGTTSSYGLLVDMNTVFEKAVERAFRDAVGGRPGWSVEGQATTRSLLAGRDAPNLRPDVLVRGPEGPVIVADAKWKTPDTPNASDLVQVTAYQAAYEVPGLVVYPEAGRALQRSYRVKGGDRVDVRELPVAEASGGAGELQRNLVDTVDEWI